MEAKLLEDFSGTEFFELKEIISEMDQENALRFIKAFRVLKNIDCEFESDEQIEELEPIEI